jgi:hypothetical protein
MTFGRLSYNAKRCACACIQMYSLSSFAILKFNQNQDGGHFDFVNNYNVCGINGNPTLNKMMPVWCKSIKQPRSYWIYCVFSLLPFYGWELRGQDSIAPRILDNSALSKMTSVWCRYLKRFKSYSVFFLQILAFGNSRWLPTLKNEELSS